MHDVVVTVARFGFLVLLWVFVFAVIGVLRRDLFLGARSSRLVATPRGASAPAAPAGRPAKGKRGKTAHHLMVIEGALAVTRISLSHSAITRGRGYNSTLVITDYDA